MTIIRTKAQEAAIRVWQETLRNVRADVLIRASCWREGKSLYLCGNELDLDQYRRIVILGAGKASAAMGQALEELVRDVPVEGLIVTKYEHSVEVPRVEVIEAGHPLPDANSVLAGVRMLDLAAAATSKDLVLVLISGGASALLEAPVEGVDLRDIQLITQSLLFSGADIRQLNTVRSCLSKIKAGGLARACGEARVVTLLLSDVPGNPREVVGSGPCWGAPPPGAEALAILRERHIPIQEAVEQALHRENLSNPANGEHMIVGDIYTLLEAAHRAAEGVGLKPKVYGRTFSGEAREVGARMAAETLAIRSENAKFDCVIAAGETTVHVRGNGKGGRNQELACAAALALGGVGDVALLALGTDGTDGPTDAAGGLIDGETYQRANLEAALAKNDCYHALEAADALVITGPTQTNLNDIVIIVRVPEH